MTQCYLDANVLVYLKDPSSPFRQEAVKLLEKLTSEKMKIIISPLDIDEFLHATASLLRIAGASNIFKYLEKSLQFILKIPNLEIKNPPESLKENSKIVGLMKKYQLSPRDAYHLLIMKAHKISHFATFDNDFEGVFAKKLVNLFN